MGGGHQTLFEATQARAAGKPVFAVANDQIQGAGAKLPEGNYRSGDDAGKAALAWYENTPYQRWLAALPPRIIKFDSIDQARAHYAGKQLIAFMSWAERKTVSSPAEQRAQVMAALDKLDPRRHVIVTSGAHKGAEKLVDEIAKARGFTVLAATTPRIPDSTTSSWGGLVKRPSFFEQSDGVVTIGRNWANSPIGLVNLVDGLVSFGGGPTVHQQLMYARRRGIPFVHLSGHIPEADVLAGDLDPASTYRDGAQALDSLLARLPSKEAVPR